jgi:hypothetical protein
VEQGAASVQVVDDARKEGEDGISDLARKREVLAAGVEQDGMQSLLEAGEREAAVFDLLLQLSQDRF